MIDERLNINNRSIEIMRGLIEFKKILELNDLRPLMAASEMEVIPDIHANFKYLDDAIEFLSKANIKPDFEQSDFEIVLAATKLNQFLLAELTYSLREDYTDDWCDKLSKMVVALEKSIENKIRNKEQL